MADYSVFNVQTLSKIVVTLSVCQCRCMKVVWCRFNRVGSTFSEDEMGVDPEGFERYASKIAQGGSDKAETSSTSWSNGLVQCRQSTL